MQGTVALHVHVNTTMFGKKSKKPKTLNNRLFGVFTNIAVGPLGFQADLDIYPEGDPYDELSAG